MTNNPSAAPENERPRADCEECGDKKCPCNMTDEELDAELLENGITPEDIDKSMNKIMTAIPTGWKRVYAILSLSDGICFETNKELARCTLVKGHESECVFPSALPQQEEPPLQPSVREPEPRTMKSMRFSIGDRNILTRALDLALGDRHNALDSSEKSDKEYIEEIRREISRMQAMRDRFSGPKPNGGYKSR